MGTFVLTRGVRLVRRLFILCVYDFSYKDTEKGQAIITNSRHTYHFDCHEILYLLQNHRYTGTVLWALCCQCAMATNLHVHNVAYTRLFC